MRRKIDQLLNGKFEYDPPKLILSEDRIEQEAEHRKILTGSFRASAPGEKKVRGFLYSSNPRVSFEPSQFYGQENKISYQVDMSGIAPGGTTEGFFTLCTDLGEYSVPYSFHLKGEGRQTADGREPMSVEHLAALASSDVHTARAVFSSPETHSVRSSSLI